MPYRLRLAIIVGSSNNKVFCNCGDQSGPGDYGALECCHVVDFGIIYEEEPDLSGVCEPCECAGPPPYTSPAPHGRPDLDWRRACARLVVLTQASTSGGGLDYADRFVYYSRQPEQLPAAPDICDNPIICPAENGIYKCCTETNVAPNGNLSFVSKARGNCQECGGEPDCSGEAKVLHSYSLSPCQLSSGSFLAGYAYAPDDWWFLDDGAFNNLTQDILQYDPYANRRHTIYMYFAMKSKYIRCCDYCTVPAANYHQGPCGSSTWLGLRDKEEREKAVQIYCAVGFSVNSCGFTPESACSLAASTPPA